MSIDHLEGCGLAPAVEEKKKKHPVSRNLDKKTTSEIHQLDCCRMNRSHLELVEGTMNLF